MGEIKHAPWRAYGTSVYFANCAGGFDVAGCPDPEEKARICAAAPDMLTALETVLAGGHLTTGEQAIVANAIAKALGISIDEVLRAGE